MKRILVVDDDKPILELLRFELASRHFDVLTAQNESEFRKLAGGSPDLIILDIWLGNTNGVFIYNDLLSQGLLDGRVPVIFITALMQDKPPVHAQDGRTYAFFCKPFDTDEIVEEIHHLFDFPM